MSTRHYIIATAGHVDHGKSALVKALTGTDPDRLPEEKARGITIDLGFARLELAARNHLGGEQIYDLGLVDVPGHEDFVKNMVAGVGSVDLALFVVAADDGWMPQTEEHLQILTYLGLERAVIALTKIDLVAGHEASAIQQVRDQLRGTPFAAAPIVPTSVVSGRGLEELKTALTGVLAGTPPPRDLGKPRLPVDRVFTLRGLGTVVTGTLNGGTLARGQAVVLQPSGQAAHVRSVQTHHHDVAAAGPGTRVALNLPELAVADKTAAAGEVARGQVVTLAGLGGPGETFDVLLEKTARLLDRAAPAARPLKDGALVRVHHGSANYSARVLLRDPTPLAPGQRALAQLRLAAPAFLFAGDRFIVRDWSEQATLAGGTVLDPDARRETFRAASQQLFLERRALAPRHLETLAATQLARDHAVCRSALLLKSGFSAMEIAGAVAHLVRENTASVAGELVLDAAWWTALRQRAAAAIQAEHHAHSERAGLGLAELRRALADDVADDEVFDALLAELTRTEFTRDGAHLRRATHRPALPPALQTAGARLRAALAAKPFEPPPRQELAPDALTRQALRFLIETGEAVEAGAETVLLAEQYARAREVIRQFIRERGPATAGELRQALHTSRRVIIPLLERLDREGVTRRQGDQRVLR